MLKKILPIALLFAGFQANASIITSNSGNYTHDTTTDLVVGGGLEWLQWDRTVGMSWQNAYDQRDTIEGGGWSIASNSQVASLFNDFAFGVTFGDNENAEYRASQPFTSLESQLEADRLFVSMFGDTRAAGGGSCSSCRPNDTITQSAAWYGSDADADGHINVANVLDDYTRVIDTFIAPVDGVALMQADVWKPGTVGSFTGVALVRSVDARVPEPSIIALFAAGLFGIGFARRRQS